MNIIKKTLYTILFSFVLLCELTSSGTCWSVGNVGSCTGTVPAYGWRWVWEFSRHTDICSIWYRAACQWTLFPSAWGFLCAVWVRVTVQFPFSSWSGVVLIPQTMTLIKEENEYTDYLLHLKPDKPGWRQLTPKLFPQEHILWAAHCSCTRVKFTGV